MREAPPVRDLADIATRRYGEDVWIRRNPRPDLVLEGAVHRRELQLRAKGCTGRIYGQFDIHVWGGILPPESEIAERLRPQYLSHPGRPGRGLQSAYQGALQRPYGYHPGLGTVRPDDLARGGGGAFET